MRADDVVDDAWVQDGGAYVASGRCRKRPGTTEAGDEDVPTPPRKSWRQRAAEKNTPVLPAALQPRYGIVDGIRTEVLIVGQVQRLKEDFPGTGSTLAFLPFDPKAHAGVTPWICPNIYGELRRLRGVFLDKDDTRDLRLCRPKYWFETNIWTRFGEEDVFSTRQLLDSYAGEERRPRHGWIFMAPPKRATGDAVPASSKASPRLGMGDAFPAVHNASPKASTSDAVPALPKTPQTPQALNPQARSGTPHREPAPQAPQALTPRARSSTLHGKAADGRFEAECLVCHMVDQHSYLPDGEYPKRMKCPRCCTRRKQGNWRILSPQRQQPSQEQAPEDHVRPQENDGFSAECSDCHLVHQRRYLLGGVYPGEMRCPHCKVRRRIGKWRVHPLHQDTAHEQATAGGKRGRSPTIPEVAASGSRGISPAPKKQATSSLPKAPDSEKKPRGRSSTPRRAQGADTAKTPCRRSPTPHRTQMPGGWSAEAGFSAECLECHTVVSRSYFPGGGRPDRMWCRGCKMSRWWASWRVLTPQQPAEEHAPEDRACLLAEATFSAECLECHTVRQRSCMPGYKLTKMWCYGCKGSRGRRCWRVLPSQQSFRRSGSPACD